jgi:hypothetical protein
MSRFTIIRRTLASSVTSGAAALLAACAAGSYGPGSLAAGQTEADARARLGEPTVRTALPDGGARLDFARGPYGRHTWRVEVGAGGSIRSVSQLLTETNFGAVRPGWSRQQVQDRLGPPSETRTGWRGLGDVASYRYEWLSLCRWFQVWYVDDRVREAGYAPDPECDERRKLRGGD